MSLRIGAPRFESVNTSIVETAANTLTPLQVEVPNSIGAKAVVMKYAELEVDLPDIVATRSVTYGLLQVGKKTPTATNLSQADAVMNANVVEEGGAGPVTKGLLISGPECRDCRIPIRSEQDGKYYVTLAVKGVNNTGAKNCYLRAEFEVYR